VDIARQFEARFALLRASMDAVGITRLCCFRTCQRHVNSETPPDPRASKRSAIRWWKSLSRPDLGRAAETVQEKADLVVVAEATDGSRSRSPGEHRYHAGYRSAWHLQQSGAQSGSSRLIRTESAI
jgi:hypothetical protein